MDNQLLKILDSIKPSPEDENNFGERIIFIVKKSNALHNPENGYAYLKQFLKDETDFLSVEIAHTKKYVHTVFHPNVSGSRGFEKEICEKILEELNKL